MGSLLISICEQKRRRIAACRATSSCIPYHVQSDLSLSQIAGSHLLSVDVTMLLAHPFNSDHEDMKLTNSECLSMVLSCIVSTRTQINRRPCSLKYVLQIIASSLYMHSDLMPRKSWLMTLQSTSLFFSEMAGWRAEEWIVPDNHVVFNRYDISYEA